MEQRVGVGAVGRDADMLARQQAGGQREGRGPRPETPSVRPAGRCSRIAQRDRNHHTENVADAHCRPTACCTLRTAAPLPNIGELASLTAIADMPTSEARMRVSTLIDGSSLGFAHGFGDDGRTSGNADRGEGFCSACVGERGRGRGCVHDGMGLQRPSFTILLNKSILPIKDFTFHGSSF